MAGYPILLWNYTTGVVDTGSICIFSERNGPKEFVRVLWSPLAP